MGAVAALVPVLLCDGLDATGLGELQPIQKLIYVALIFRKWHFVLLIDPSFWSPFDHDLNTVICLCSCDLYQNYQELQDVTSVEVEQSPGPQIVTGH